MWPFFLSFPQNNDWIWLSLVTIVFDVLQVQQRQGRQGRSPRRRRHRRQPRRRPRRLRRRPGFESGRWIRWTPLKRSLQRSGRGQAVNQLAFLFTERPHASLPLNALSLIARGVLATHHTVFLPPTSYLLKTNTHHPDFSQFPHFVDFASSQENNRSFLPSFSRSE